MGNYGATVSAVSIAEVAKEAIAAGADILLMPSDIPATIDGVVAGVAEGRYTQARVDSSVRRVLEMKERFHLHDNRYVDIDTMRRRVGDSANVNVARYAAERSITLVKDSLGAVPLAHTPGVRPRVLSITIARRSDLGAGTTFDSTLKQDSVIVRSVWLNPSDAGAEADHLLALSDSADAVVLGSYLSGGSTVSTLSAPDTLVRFIRAMVARKPRTILVSLGNPYLLQQMPDVPAYLVTYGPAPVSQRAAAMAISGALTVDGKLPITIPPFAPFGTGLHREATHTLPAPRSQP
jgi:beta-N-acetylhexosaminidase